ncbi:thiamine pyrophosphate-dependent enzyme [Alphaproteobacteria bacterium]|nr:thiamine pyrophosphate-dependent enzyme [Alphaproteobacteria bacterium]
MRAFENILLNLFSENKIGGTTHTCIGQELSGALVGYVAKKHDIVISNHRCHGHYLGLTNDFKGLASELLGYNSGINAGVGGSQHIAVPGRFYSNGIQGGMVSYSAGIAKNLHNKKNGVVINFIGDGTFGEGALYEGINIASIFKSPVLFFVENNNIAQTTETSDVFSGSIKKRFEGFGIECIEHSHDDIDGLFNSINTLTQNIRDNPSPKSIIWNCFRLGPHSKGDDTRSLEKINELWRQDIVSNYYNNSISSNINYKEALQNEIEEIHNCFSNDKNVKLNKRFSKGKNESNKLMIDSTIYKKQENLTLIAKINLCLRNYLDKTKGIIIGEDIAGEYGGAFKATKGLSTNYPDRILNSPISESGIVGFGIGYSSNNCTIIIEIMFGDFITLTADQIINHCSKFSFLHEDSSPSIIIRTPIGGGRGYGATHSQSIEKILGGFPNIFIEQLSFMHNIDDCFTNAINRPGCTIITEPKLQYAKEYKKLNKFASNFFKLDYFYKNTCEWLSLNSDGRESNLTLICTGIALPICLKAAEDLMLKHEISVNIFCPRMTSPIYIPDEVHDAMTEKILIVDETYSGYGFIETLSTKIAVENTTKRIIRLYCLKDNIYPASIELEQTFIINPSKLTLEAKKLNDI